MSLNIRITAIGLALVACGAPSPTSGTNDRIVTAHRIIVDHDDGTSSFLSEGLAETGRARAPYRVPRGDRQ